MLYSDRILSDVESIHLKPKKAHFEVDGLDLTRRSRSDKSFEIAPSLADRVMRDHERKMRLTIHAEQIKIAKQLLRVRRKKAALPYRTCKSVGKLAARSGLLEKGREAIFLFLITGVVFQMGIIFHSMGFLNN